MSLSFFDLDSLVNAAGLGAGTAQSLTLLFLVIIAIVTINACLLVGASIVGVTFLRRMRVSSGELERERREAHEKAEALLETARKESFGITEEAHKKAGELLHQTQAVKETLEAGLTQALHDFSQKESERVAHVSGELVEAYRGMIESTKQQYGAATAGTAKEMADVAQTTMKQFEEFLKDQTTRYEGALKQQVQAGFMSAQKEIGDYKRESLRKVEDAIYRILNLVTKSVLGKALSLEDQQDLVIHALDEVKQQGFFEL